MTDSPRQQLRERLKVTIEAVLVKPVDPGMGGPHEPIWETYRPEGVAVLIAAAVSDWLVEAGWGPTAAHEACLQRFIDGWKVVNERWSRPAGDGTWEHDFLTPAEQEVMSR